MKIKRKTQISVRTEKLLMVRKSKPSFFTVCATCGAALVTINDNDNSIYSINPASVNTSAAGGGGIVTVTTPAGCNWTAVSHAGWISINSGGNGSGNGTVNYSVAPNDGQARQGTVTIGGQTFTVIQAAAGLTRKPANFDGNGKTDLAVFRPPDTNWDVQKSGSGFLIRQFGASGDLPAPAGYLPQ